MYFCPECDKGPFSPQDWWDHFQSHNTPWLQSRDPENLERTDLGYGEDLKTTTVPTHNLPNEPGFTPEKFGWREAGDEASSDYVTREPEFNPQEFEQWIQQYGPLFYHITKQQNVNNILNQGLLTWRDAPEITWPDQWSYRCPECEYQGLQQDVQDHISQTGHGAESWGSRPPQSVAPTGDKIQPPENWDSRWDLTWLGSGTMYLGSDWNERSRGEQPQLMVDVRYLDPSKIYKFFVGHWINKVSDDPNAQTPFAVIAYEGSIPQEAIRMNPQLKEKYVHARQLTLQDMLNGKPRQAAQIIPQAHRMVWLSQPNNDQLKYWHHNPSNTTYAWDGSENRHHWSTAQHLGIDPGAKANDWEGGFYMQNEMGRHPADLWGLPSQVDYAPVQGDGDYGNSVF